MTTQPPAGKFDAVDQSYLSRRRELAKTITFESLFEIADQFGLYSGAHTIGRSLAIYEAFKSVANVPGDIFEFGCWKGSNLLFMAKLLTLLQPHSIKHVYGFDSFEGLQTFSVADGESARERFQGQYRGDLKTLQQFIDLHDMSDWVHLVIGDANETIDQFDKSNSYTMISLAYIDFDLYEPCLKALEFSDSRLSVGGMIILDEALIETWKGEGQALREFLASRKGDYEMSSNPISRQPTVFLKKIR